MSVRCISTRMEIEEAGNLYRRVDANRAVLRYRYSYKTNIATATKPICYPALSHRKIAVAMAGKSFNC